VAQGHHGHGQESGGYIRAGPERGEESGHRGCWPGGLDTCRPDAARGTEEAGGAPTAAAWRASQISANAKTKPKVEPSTGTFTETSTDTDAESHVDAECGNIIGTYTDQTMGDCPTTNPEETRQPSPSPENRLDHGRQTPNREER